jgi:YegS/Rv2252/BmrU family lipid kinase
VLGSKTKIIHPLILKKAFIVYHHRAGGGGAQKVLVKLLSFLTKHNFSFYVYQTKKAFDTTSMRQSFLTSQADFIVTCGGDGTAHDALNALWDVSKPWLILPAGSGNDFVKMVYGKNELPTYFSKLLQPKIQKVDIGKCNERYFLNGVGIGIDGAIAKDAVSNPWLPSFLKYQFAILKNIFIFNDFRFTTKVEGVSFQSQAILLTVANGSAYGGGFLIAPHAKIDDGQLDHMEIAPIPRLLRPKFIGLIKNGKHLNLPIVTTKRIEQIEIIPDSLREVPAHADGEMITASKYHIQILPKALTLLV